MENEVTGVDNPEGEDVPGGEKIAPQVGPGTVLENYRLDRLISRGLTGELYQGHNLVAGKPCAVKVFHPAMPLGPVAMGRYMHENQRVADLGTPGIAEVFATGQAQGRDFAVMGIHPGEALRLIVRQRAPLSRRFYLPVLRAICSALSPLHAQGLFHGHLHGGQVLLRWEEGSSPQVTLLDFGVRHLLPGIKEQISGWERKPEHAVYLSPEQAKGNPGDARSDVYALSVMLYEMVTGKVPFLAEALGDTVDQIISEPPIAPGKLAQLPEQVEETILRGMEKDPRGRIPSVEALYAALDPRGITSDQSGVHDMVSPGTGRHAVLLSGPVTDEISGHEEPGAPIPLDLDDLDELDDAAVVGRPRRRLLLLAGLAVALLLCGGAVAWFLLGGDDKKKGVSKEPRPAVRANKAARPGAKAPAHRRIKPAKKKAPKPAPKPVARTKAPPPAPEPEPEPEPVEDKKPPIKGIDVVARNLPTRANVHPGVAAGMVKKIKGWGSLRVLTGSREAKVFVNGNLRGAGEVVLLEKIPADKYRIIVEKGGIKLPHRDVEVQPDQRLDLSF